jgi:hypothetical protein
MCNLKLFFVHRKEKWSPASDKSWRQLLYLRRNPPKHPPSQIVSSINAAIRRIADTASVDYPVRVQPPIEVGGFLRRRVTKETLPLGLFASHFSAALQTRLRLRQARPTVPEKYSTHSQPKGNKSNNKYENIG